MTINEILKYSINTLRKNNIDEPILKSKILVAHILGKEKEYLIINGEKKLDISDIEKVKKGISRLAKGCPIQYITNMQEFMGLEFWVNENVLIPQPDTEILAEEVINLGRQIKNVKILDLCTGSGAIAISIAKNINVKKIIASDISKEALKVAKLNCKRYNLENVELKFSNLFENIHEKFNIIVSNPPYIKTDVIKSLSKEVQNEPYIALNGGQDGLEFYRKIINKAYEYLEEDGYLCLEIGYDQKDEVMGLIENSNKYKAINSKKDLTGNDRMILCRKK